MRVILFIFSLFIFTSVFSQKGPGGVSLETLTNSDVKIWYNATYIPLSDGDNVVSLSDLSLSLIQNNAEQTTFDNQPIYRNATSSSINGNPVMKFSGNEKLLLNSSSDINTQRINERTMAIVFRTGNDVTSTQVVYEQGGTVRGLNIYIENDSLYSGGYDLNVDGDGTPSWGWSGMRNLVSPNQVCVLIFEYDVSGNVVVDGTIKSWLNGSLFTDLLDNGGVGSLSSHPGQPGLGGTNGKTVAHDNLFRNNVNFDGDIAEFVSYSRVLNNAERIILENYLGSKYSSSPINNDYFSYDVNYGNDVIGIGQELTSSNQHLISQGLNPYIITADASILSNNSYLLAGHNKLDMSSWISSNVSSKVNTQTLDRIWKVQNTLISDSVLFTIDKTMLPPLPVNHKYVVLIDDNGGVVPDFNNSKVYELSNNGSGDFYSRNVLLTNGSYFTVGIVNPSAYFETTSITTYEADIDEQVDVEVYLNYIPFTSINLNFNHIEVSAIYGENDDYADMPLSGNITFPSTDNKSIISFEVEGDMTAENTESFQLQLIPSGDVINVFNETATITINDNDNAVKLGFNISTSVNVSVQEDANLVNLEIIRSGDLSGVTDVSVRLDPNSTYTAKDISDYIFSPITVSFDVNETSKLISFTVIDDNDFEADENFVLELYNISSFSDISVSDAKSNITILDNDVTPIIEFSESLGIGTELNGSPVINVQLTHLSYQDVSVDYVISGGSATESNDYFSPISGVVTVPAGSLVAQIPLTVVSDGIENEGDETIIYQISNSINGVLGSTHLSYTYTITDYSDFEWTGIAGIGKANDNSLWLDATQLNIASGNQVSLFSDFSPNSRQISKQTNLTAQPIKVDGVIGGLESLAFYNGSEFLEFDDNNVINTGSSLSQKVISFVVQPTYSFEDKQTIFVQGGTGRALIVYINNGVFCVNVYNRSDAPGWGSGSGTSDVIINGTTSINDGQNYIVTVVYDGENSTETLALYVNGNKEGSALANNQNGTYHAFMGSHNNAYLGSNPDNVYYFNGDNTGGANFEGFISEFIYFNDVSSNVFNTTRRKILENYLSDKYTISITNQKLILGDATLNGDYKFDVAGIGQENSNDKHLDSRGKSIVRVNSADDLNDLEYLFWAHNNLPKTVPNYTDKPVSINNRLERVWKIYEPSGDVGNVNISFDVSEFRDISNINDLVLLIDNIDDVFIDADISNTTKTINGNTITFEGVNLLPNSFVTLGSTSSASPLPVELLYFDGEVLNENNVRLSWATATESNNQKFEIYRAFENANFEKITELNGIGYSSSEVEYSFLDEDLKNGQYYYRLKQIDFNGDSEVFNIIAVNILSSNNIEAYVHYNNHLLLTDEVILKLDGNIEGPEEFEVYNQSGQLIFSDIISTSSKSISDEIDYSRGVYIIKFKNEKINSVRFIINE